MRRLLLPVFLVYAFLAFIAYVVVWRRQWRDAVLQFVWNTIPDGCWYDGGPWLAPSTRLHLSNLRRSK